MRTTAATVDDYLRDLPAERRTVVTEVRELVRRHLPAGYEESLQFGMIAWGIPLARFKDTYNGQPLGIACLAAQKNHFALYLMGPYMDPAVDAGLREGFRAAGKRLDMGKSCVRFKATDDLALEAIGAAIAAIPPERLIEMHDAVHGAKRTRGTRSPAASSAAGAAGPSAKKAPAKKAPGKKAPAKRAATKQSAAKQAGARAAARKRR